MDSRAQEFSPKCDRTTLEVVIDVVGCVFRGPISESRIFTCEVIVRL